MGDYKVQFEVFEGPLDLLLYLVKKQEVDIYDVNLTRLAREFLACIELMTRLDLEVAGDFLVMASTLLYIKSRELLPTNQQVAVEAEPDEEDPRWELIRQLVEYKKFKDAAAEFQCLEIQQESVFLHTAAKIQFEPEPAAVRATVSIFDLVTAVTGILKRFQSRDQSSDIFADQWSVSEKIDFLRLEIGVRRRMRFSELFAEAASRIEVVVTFLAVLELTRLKLFVCSQSEAFSEIEISLASDPLHGVVGGTDPVGALPTSKPQASDADVPSLTQVNSNDPQPQTS